MGGKIYCVKWQTWRGTGMVRDISSPVSIHECNEDERECPLCTGWGHTQPGHAAHVRARSPAGALARALGVSHSTARRWLNRGRAYVWDVQVLPDPAAGRRINSEASPICI